MAMTNPPPSTGSRELTAWSLIDEYIGLAPEERQQRLDGLSPERRGAVEAMLERAQRGVVESLESPPADFRFSAAGDRIGPYLLQEELAQGGTASVFRAVRADNLHDRPLAVKVVHFASLREKEQLFRQEIRVLARLDHRGIVRLIDGGVTGQGVFYLVTEYIRGFSLHVASRKLTLTLRQRVELMAEICSAVAYAHDLGIVHRDLKPSNVLVSPDGQPKLLDFGIARFKEEAADNAEPTLLTRMTAEYASPEQLRREKPLTETSDTYSLGVMLHELLLGNRPSTPQDSGETEPPTPRFRGVDPDLEAVLQKALAFQRRDRYQHARELEQDLNAWLAGTPVAARKLGVFGRAWKWAHRNRKRAIIMAAAVLSGAIIVGFWWNANHRRRLALSVAQQLPLVTRYSTPRLLETYLARDLALIDEAERLNGSVPELQYVRLSVLCKAAEAMGYPGVSSFGNFARARAIFEQAVRVVEQALAGGTPPSALFPFVYTASLGLGAVLLEMGETEPAERALQQAWDLLNRAAASNASPEPEVLTARPNVLMQISRVSVRRGQHQLALLQRQQALRMALDAKGVYHETEIAGMRLPLAWSQRATGDLRGALQTYREAETVMRRNRDKPVRGDETLSWLARNLYEQGRILAQLNRLPESRQALEESVVRLESLLEQSPASGERRRWLGLSEAYLAYVLARMGDTGRRTRMLAGSARALLREVRSNSKGNVYIDEEFREVEQLLRSIRE